MDKSSGLKPTHQVTIPYTADLLEKDNTKICEWCWNETCGEVVKIAFLHFYEFVGSVWYHGWLGLLMLGLIFLTLGCSLAYCRVWFWSPKMQGMARVWQQASCLASGANAFQEFSLDVDLEGDASGSMISLDMMVGKRCNVWTKWIWSFELYILSWHWLRHWNNLALGPKAFFCETLPTEVLNHMVSIPTSDLCCFQKFFKLLASFPTFPHMWHVTVYLTEVFLYYDLNFWANHRRFSSLVLLHEDSRKQWQMIQYPIICSIYCMEYFPPFCIHRSKT